MIALISSSLSNITNSKARLFDSIQITLYVLPAAISVLATYLISHRIYLGSVPLTSNGHRMRQGNRMKGLIEIILQSSAIYTVVLLTRAALSSPAPLAERRNSRLSLEYESAGDYLDISLTLLAVCVDALVASIS